MEIYDTSKQHVCLASCREEISFRNSPPEMAAQYVSRNFDRCNNHHCHRALRKVRERKARHTGIRIPICEMWRNPFLKSKVYSPCVWMRNRENLLLCRIEENGEGNVRETRRSDERSCITDRKVTHLSGFKPALDWRPSLQSSSSLSLSLARRSLLGILA